MQTLRRRKSILFPSLLRSSMAAAPSATTTTTASFTASLSNSRLKPNSHLTYLINIPKPLSLHNHHRSFRIFASKKPPPIETQNEPPPIDTQLEPPPSLSSVEKRSFAVATGELFLGIASRLIGGRKTKSPLSPPGDETESGERIGAVIEDSVEPEVLWEQRVKDIEAEKRRSAVTSPGFSFSAAGLLFPYHLGVAQFLLDNGYIKETTPLAGSSAGAIVCAVVASGKSMQEALDATKILAEDCRLRGTAFRLGAVLRDILENVLPDDIHIRCNGRVRVAVTQIVWRPRGLLIDQFDSKEDLINALFTSSFIPGYLAPRPATMFRNRLCIDGGLTLFMPPTSASQTVRVCAFPASTLRMRGIGISPDCNPENKLSTRQLFNWALEPADDNVLDKLFEFGYLDAAIWAKENPVNSVLQDETL